MVNPWRGLSGLPRISFAIALATFINRAGVMIRPFLMIYLIQQLGFSTEAAGWTLFLYGVTTLVAAPLSGWLTDRLGARVVLRGALLVAALAMLLYPFARTPLQVAVATIVFSLFNEMPRPALMTLVADVAPAPLRKQAFVLSRLAINFGLSIGPAAGGFLYEWHWWSLFVVDAGASLAAALLLLRLPLPLAERSERPAGSALGVLLGDRALLVFFAATVLTAVMFFQHESTLSIVMVHDLGLPKWHYGLMFTVNTALIVLLEVEINTRLQHWSHKRSLVIGGLLTTAGFGGLVFTGGLSGTAATLAVATTVVVWTFGEMIAMPAMSAFVVEIAPPTRRGLYMGTLTLAFGAGLTLGPKLGTTLLEASGATVLWLAVGAVGLASCALYACLPAVRSPARPEPEQAAAAAAAETATMDAAAQ